MGVEKNKKKIEKSNGKDAEDLRIVKEKKRLKRLFDKVAEEKRILAEPLIENAAFMRILLLDLQQAITERGAIDDYQNGENQYGSKMSAELQAYNRTMASYTAVNTKLRQLLPDDLKGALNEDDGEEFFRKFGT